MPAFHGVALGTSIPVVLMALTLAELSVVSAMLTAVDIRETSIELRGPFSLEEVALMGFGHRDERRFDGVMRLAFGLDGDPESTVGVEIRQLDDRLGLVVHGAGDL